MPDTSSRRDVTPGRLRRRLTLAFIAVAGFSAAALGAGSYAMVAQARFEDSLTGASGRIGYELLLAQQFLPLDEGRTAALLASFEGAGVDVVLITAAGTFPSNASLGGVPGEKTRSVVGAGQVAFERLTTPSGSRVLLVGGRIPGSDTELYVVHGEDRIHQDLALLRTVLGAGCLAVVLLAALAGQSLARRTLEPVGRAGAAARAIAEGLLATRLPVRGRDEFDAWAESFNRMAEALEAKITALSRAEARERRFTADVAHELRTPVTALVAAASLLREHIDGMPEPARRPAQLIVADITRLRNLVADLMEISRLDSGPQEVWTRPVELTARIRAIVDERGFSSRVRLSGGPAWVRSDPRRLERVLANLIANALEHGGGEAIVHVAGAQVSVTDHGAGIAPGHLPRLFERFYKADPARSTPGSGLGLAIAYENARLLGAELTVSSRVGEGTTARLRLPVAQLLPDGEGAVPEGVERDPA